MWKPSGALSQQEEQIAHKIQKAKLFVFLRKPRHELFDEAFRGARKPSLLVNDVRSEQVLPSGPQHMTFQIWL